MIFVQKKIFLLFIFLANIIYLNLFSYNSDINKEENKYNQYKSQLLIKNIKLISINYNDLPLFKKFFCLIKDKIDFFINREDYINFIIAVSKEDKGKIGEIQEKINNNFLFKIDCIDNLEYNINDLLNTCNINKTEIQQKENEDIILNKNVNHEIMQLVLYQEPILSLNNNDNLNNLILTEKNNTLETLENNKIRNNLRKKVLKPKNNNLSKYKKEKIIDEYSYSNTASKIIQELYKENSNKKIKISNKNNKRRFTIKYIELIIPNTKINNKNICYKK